MTLKTLVGQWLVTNGYDGLCSENCGCEIADLMPCDEPRTDCLPGHKIDCPGPELCHANGDCAWHIGQNC